MNIRELARKERATAEMNRSINRYNIECGKPVSWQLTPEQLEDIKSGKLKLEDLTRDGTSK